MKFLAASLTAALAFLPAAAAHAADVDVSTILTDQTDAPMQDCARVEQDQKSPDFGKCVEFAPLTLGRLAAGAVDVSDSGLTPEGVLSRGTLAKKIRTALKVGPDASGKVVVHLDDEEVKLIQQQILKLHLPPSVILQAHDMLPAVK